MPIHDLGYRPWNGKAGNDATRWWVIAATGIKIIFRNLWVRRLMLLSWTPTLICGIIVFSFERYLETRPEFLIPQESEVSKDLPLKNIVNLDEERDELRSRIRELLRQRMGYGLGEYEVEEAVDAILFDPNAPPIEERVSAAEAEAESNATNEQEELNKALREAGVEFRDMDLGKQQVDVQIIRDGKVISGPGMPRGPPRKSRNFENQKRGPRGKGRPKRPGAGADDRNDSLQFEAQDPSDSDAESKPVRQPRKMNPKALELEGLEQRFVEEFKNLRSTTSERFQAQARERFRRNALPAGFPERDAIMDAIFAMDKTEARVNFWSVILLTFLQYPQGGLLLLLIGLIAPPLISNDVRSKAFLLYFSRPINRWEYIFGKLMVIACFVATITLLPTMALYFFCILMSPDLTPLAQTWHLPFQIFLAALVAVIPTSALSLALSSLTSESRFAGFAWFAIWTIGAVAWMIIFIATTIARAEEMGPEALELDSQFTMLSLYHTIGKVQRFVFGFENNFLNVLPSILLIVGITAFSLRTLWKRVSAPINV